MLAGEHRPGAAEADGDLVGDQEHVAAVSSRTPREVALGVNHHPAAAWTSGSTTTAATSPGCRRGAAPAARRRPVRGGGLQGIGTTGLAAHEAGNMSAEEVDPADADGADRIAVVRVARSERSCAASAWALSPVLKGHLEGDLHGGRPAVGVEDAREARRRARPGARASSVAGGEPQQGRVGDPVELLAQGRVDPRVAVAVDVAPERRDAVEVPTGRRGRSGRRPRPAR